MSRPVLNGDQKAYLIYELMLWAINNEKVNSADTPKANLFSLMKVIVNDAATPMIAANGQLFIQQLRKSGDLWEKVRPFLKNSGHGCINPIPPGSTYWNKCGHEPEDHVDGKCTGTHSQRVDNPDCPPGVWDYSKRYTHIKTPCPCTCYRTNQKW